MLLGLAQMQIFKFEGLSINILAENASIDVSLIIMLLHIYLHQINANVIRKYVDGFEIDYKVDFRQKIAQQGGQIMWMIL